MWSCSVLASSYPTLLIWHCDLSVNLAKGVSRQKTTLQKEVNFLLVYHLQLLTADSECQCEREGKGVLLLGVQVDQLSCNLKLHPNSAICSSTAVVPFSFTSVFEDLLYISCLGYGTMKNT